MRVCIVSTYPPRACGLGTFTANLRESLVSAPDVESVDIVAVVRDSEGGKLSQPAEVVYALAQDDIADYRRLAAFINSAGYDVVSVQHEFGIFGGDGGIFVAELTSRLEVPVVTTLHTVLSDPPANLRHAFLAVADTSDALVTMSDAALPLLPTVAGRSGRGISVIPHGVPDVGFVDPDPHKAAIGLEGRFILLTFGLLSANKGIEETIRALPPVVSEHPEVCYVVLGATHPEVLRHDGESYRNGLIDLITELGLEDNVELVDRYSDEEELLRYIRACDIYITPYQSVEQISSGTLAYAVGVGRAVVSTPYRFAQALLQDGTGRLVGFHDDEEMAGAIRDLIENEAERERLQHRAYEVGRSMTWPQIGRNYARLFTDVVMDLRLQRDLAGRVAFPVITPSLDRLHALSDDVGVLQHARYGVPDRVHGYTTDDNARALLAMVLHARVSGDELAVRLAERYLAYVSHAQRVDGWFRNTMGYDRRWRDSSGTQDTLGQAIWGLGVAAAAGTTQEIRSMASSVLVRSLPAARDIGAVRSAAYALCGLTAVATCHAAPDGPVVADLPHGDLSGTSPELPAEAARELTDLLAGRLTAAYLDQADAEWRWCDASLTYANTKVPEALLRASEVCGRDDWRALALDSLDFILERTLLRGQFVPIGNAGWYHRDGVRPLFGQQPIEAGYTAQACALAWSLTGRASYREAGVAALEWLMGRNAARIPLYDATTGACRDGLDRHGVSSNTGAESVICGLLAMLTLPALGLDHPTRSAGRTPLRV